MADAGSLLGQLIGAALGGGGNKANAGGGALGDILGQVLGGGKAPQGGQGGQGGLPGGLGDILGQVLGGGGSARTGGAGGAAPQGGGGLEDILGQVLGGKGGAGGGLGDILGQVLGGGYGGDKPAPSGRAGGGLGDMVGDALGGRTEQVPVPAPGNVPAPQPQRAPTGGTQPSSGNDFMKYGGLAVIGMIAFNAFRKWQQSQGARAGFAADAKPADFGPAAAPGGPAAFSETLLAAMTAAAQADGRIDQEELNRITGGLEKMGASGMDQQQLIQILTTPVDPQTVVDAASSPEAALQIYTASVMAIRADTAVEQQYLANLAGALGIDPGLKAQIDRDLGA